MDWTRLIARIRAAGKQVAARIRHSERPSTPGSRRPALAPPETIAPDAADHAEDFGIRYDELLEACCRRRMRELGILDSRIGAYDADFQFRLAAFFPKGRAGGENSPGARINLDSGILNPNLLSEVFAPEVSRVWEKSRLRDRMDAVIVHEDIEGREVANGEGFKAAHAAAIAQAPKTPRPITEGAYRILRAMARHTRGRENSR